MQSRSSEKTSPKVAMLPVKSVLRFVFSKVKLVILILSSLNTHSDELKKHFLEPKLSLEKILGQVTISFRYYT